MKKNNIIEAFIGILILANSPVVHAIVKFINLNTDMYVSDEKTELIINIGYFVIAAIVFIVRVATHSEKKSTPQEKSPNRLHAFPEPEAHCVVCEQTGDNHFVRDQESRLKQLEEWRKSGMITKEEYLEMKAKYKG